MHVAGIVLCGGQSTRMGQPKAWLPINGEPMLPRVVRLLSEAVSPIIVVASPGQDLPPLPSDVIVVPDPVPQRGPLQGLVAGLTALPDGIEVSYASSCDVPFLRPSFVHRIIELIGESDACMPYVHDRLHPLAAAYRRTAATFADRLLKSGTPRLTDLSKLLRTRIVGQNELTNADPDLRSLRNINTPGEYTEAMRQLCG